MPELRLKPGDAAGAVAEAAEALLDPAPANPLATEELAAVELPVADKPPVAAAAPAPLNPPAPAPAATPAVSPPAAKPTATAASFTTPIVASSA